MVDLKELYDAILEGNSADAVTITRRALGESLDPMHIVHEGMIPAMEEAGRRFEAFEFFIPEILVVASAMKKAMALIRPLLADRGGDYTGKVVIGTVKGDLHDIGKNLVASMLEGGGFEVLDLGVDVPPAQFVEQINTGGVDIIAMSALLTTTVGAMSETIAAIEEASLRDRVKIMVGGPPVNQAFADEIGADGYRDNANAAVSLARELVQPGR
ncbi:MAG: corrinoid protein [Fidelibacterota bacterium]|nr:MAG: corrinoid protein [Candidatus Neomarinimicrobiota bacterium]